MFGRSVYVLFFLLWPLHGLSAAKADYVLEGNKHYEKGAYDLAAAQYKLAIKHSQNVSFAWFNLGNCHAQRKNYPLAITAYKRSIEAAPQFARPWLLLGDIYTTYGAVGEAIVCYKRVIELEEDNSYAWKWLGENSLKAGDVTEAMRCFEASLKIDPDQVEVYFALAEAYVLIKDYQAAIDVMGDAILLSPRVDENVYTYMGYLHEQAGDTKKAVRAYEDALTLNPKAKPIYLRISKLQQQEDSDFLALLTLQGALENGLKDPDLFVERGSIYFKQGRLENALEEFRVAAGMGSTMGRIGLENVSAAYWNDGQKEKSREVLELLQ